METKIKKLPKAVFELDITIPNKDVKETYESVLLKTIENTIVQGFRKGKAPKEKVLEKTDVSELYGEVVNELLQNFYPQALKEHHIQAIANPKVEIKEFDLEKDFNFIAKVATRPDVKIGDYKKAIKKKFDEKVKKAKEELEDKSQEPHVHLHMDEVLDALVESSKVEVAEMLIEDEANRMLSKLLEQAGNIGLSLDDYLKASNKDQSKLKEEYSEIAEKNLKSELILTEIVKEQKVEVSDDEVRGAIAAQGIEDVEKAMSSAYDVMYIKSILAKNKVLGEILEEVEGHKHE